MQNWMLVLLMHYQFVELVANRKNRKLRVFYG